MTYNDLKNDLRKAFEKTGIERKCYDNKMSLSASWWELGHPDGSLEVTFWLMSDDVNVDKLINIAKTWAKKHGLIAVTYYPKGIQPNIDPVKYQDWNNTPAMFAKFIYGFTFICDNYSCKNVYTKL